MKRLDRFDTIAWRSMAAVIYGQRHIPRVAALLRREHAQVVRLVQRERLDDSTTNAEDVAYNTAIDNVLAALARRKAGKA